MNMNSSYDLLVILGHTAGGKTSVAAAVAHELKTEIISADSRQVYRGMTIGTGKDYDDYFVGDEKIPVHLLDIVDAGYEYNVFEYQKDFFEAYGEIRSRGLMPILCGGSGMYIEAVLRKYDMLHVPVNAELRRSLESKDLMELGEILASYKVMHNQTDVDTKKRVIRAIEIAEHMLRMGDVRPELPEVRALVIGINYSREERRFRITKRLKQRLDDGMIQEAEELLQKGLSHEQLEYYGLEYKFLSRYLRGDLNYKQMFDGLNIAIHQFAKRQMTYFRGMEKRGIPIKWIEGDLPIEEKVRMVLDHLYAT